MKYYEVVLLKSPLKPLTYCCNTNIDIGIKVFVTLKNRKLLSEAVVVKQVDKPQFKCSEITEISSYYYDKQMLKLADFIARYYVCSLGEALGLFIPFDKNITPSKKNIICDVDINLSIKQQEAFEFCNTHKVSLLFANTSSGKTEIYIKIIEQHINNNKQALLLMPEISLTPQMEKRLKKVFGNSVAIWHSKITKKKKDAIILGVLEGEIKIIAGARSALFLPYSDLGVIVVDEEHDDSYKSEQKPRINVKDLAIYMGKTFDIQTILGSATPSIGSFAKIPYIRLKQTFFDTKKHIVFDESMLSITSTVIHHIQNTLDKNKQVILFLPTRANFKYQICSDCGKAVECPFCSVSLSLHKNNSMLKCHYCNYTQIIPSFCPSCKTGIIKNYRLGTQEVQEQLENIFINKTIKTFDKDSIKTTKELKSVLKQFNDGKIDILVGTQMLSKGHDYHNVTLAVILGIDSILNMTSYKIREKALSLALQIAGRSGRNGVGEVLIQTKNKKFFQEFMINKDYEQFLEDELQCRADIYPPKIRMAKVVFSHKNWIKAKETMELYISWLQSYKDIELIGFKECDIFKIANKYRYEILIRSKNITSLLTFLHSIDTPLASIDMDNLY